jgi:hypothetical protein
VHRHRRQPEGVATTCAIKALGGHIQGRLWPRDDDEKQRGIDAGLKLDDYVYEADELVTGRNTIFVATGVTNGELVAGVRRDGDFVYTESVVLRGFGHAAAHLLGASHVEVALSADQIIGAARPVWARDSRTSGTMGNGVTGDTDVSTQSGVTCPQHPAVPERVR